MGLEARGEARGSASPCRAGDREARGGARELYGATREGRAQELSGTSGAGRSRGVN